MLRKLRKLSAINLRAMRIRHKLLSLYYVFGLARNYTQLVVAALGDSYLKKIYSTHVHLFLKAFQTCNHSKNWKRNLRNVISILLVRFSQWVKFSMKWINFHLYSKQLSTNITTSISRFSDNLWHPTTPHPPQFMPHGKFNASTATTPFWCPQFCSLLNMFRCTFDAPQTLTVARLMYGGI